ncbi:MAG: enoyl-CoA hydratase/isomerase family protein [Rhodobacteraceae bacterium]|nr:enoyl-CoA hydratase/isomerase family protein [Paracoccaceae bacterium]
MTSRVRKVVQDGIATITLDAPPLNVLGPDLRADLDAAVAAVLADPGARVLILTAAGRSWPAGGDIHEYDHPEADPTLRDICARLADAAKPVVAVLHGTVLGGGLELALSAAVRLAEPGTTLGLPEVSLGLVPGAGGTQRLPRLVGARAALGLLLGGLPVTAERAREIGLVDAVTGGAGAAAVALARAFLTGTAELPTAAERSAERRVDAEGWLAAVTAAREGIGAGRLPAPGRIIDCVEAALLLPGDEGADFERTAFEDLRATPESAALRHIFLAERRAARPADLDRLEAQMLYRAGIVGSGGAAPLLATGLLTAGLSVTLVEADQTALSTALARVARLHERAVERGRLSPEAREAEWARIGGATEGAALATADIVIEALPDEAARAEFLGGFDGLAKRGTLLATASLPAEVARLAEASGRPAAVVGLAGGGPVPGARLLEVVVTDETAPETQAALLALVRRMGRVPVRATDAPIGPRLFAALRTAMDHLVEEGASPYAVDRALRGWGFALGPYEMLDLTGLDAADERRRRQAIRRDPARRYVAVDDRLLAASRFGRRVGRGYYRYEDGGARRVEDPSVLAIVSEERAAKGLVARSVGTAEIEARALAALANEGVLLIEDGIARHPSDIDVVMVAGWGFPRWRGGPMQEADRIGLLTLRNALRDYAREEERFWRHGAVWDELIKNGMGFADLNRV